MYHTSYLNVPSKSSVVSPTHPQSFFTDRGGGGGGNSGTGASASATALQPPPKEPSIVVKLGGGQLSVRCVNPVGLVMYVWGRETISVNRSIDLTALSPCRHCHCVHQPDNRTISWMDAIKRQFGLSHIDYMERPK